MIEFSKDHSQAWIEMMSAYQVFREKLFDWSHEPDHKKQKDLLLELDTWESRNIHKRMLVVDFLRSTEMWDKKAILLVLKELTGIAIHEHEEIAAYTRIHNGCLILHDMHCKTEFSHYVDRYANLIEQAYGLDEVELSNMKKTLF